MGEGTRSADRLGGALQLVTTVAQVFAESTADYPKLLAVIARCVAEAIPDTCLVILRDEQELLWPVALHDADPAFVARFEAATQMRHPLTDTAFVADAIAYGQVFIPELDLDRLPASTPRPAVDRLRAIGARGVLLVPLATRGEQYGTLTVVRHQADRPPLDELDLEIVKSIASHAALAISNARLIAQLRRSEALRAAEERAVQASSLLDAIVENIPDMVFVKDAAGLAFVRLNRAGEALLGASRQDVVGKTDFDLFPRERAELFAATDREVLAATALVEIAEEQVTTPTGLRWLHTKKVPLSGPDGATRYVLGISRDITADKLAFEELREAKESAERASDELEAFSYSIAHDLRAPLRSIDGFSQALLEDYGDRLDEGGHRHIARVRGAAQRMASLIDDLLALSRVSRADLLHERLDLSAIAHAEITELRRATPTRTVEVVIAPGLVAQGDRRLVTAAIIDLLDNAWKFTSTTPAPRIELGALEPTPPGAAGTFFVRDNGVGFDMRYVHKLFGVFQRLHPNVEFPGTGIGLVTVARIVKRHRGRVWAEAEVGRGATFYFTLGDPNA